MDWKSQDNQVKAFPEVVFGPTLPVQPAHHAAAAAQAAGEMRRVVMDYDISTQRSGTGNLRSVDIWLTDTPPPPRLPLPPITHEVMDLAGNVWPMYAGGEQIVTPSASTASTGCMWAKKICPGWRYIAFKPENIPCSPWPRIDDAYLQPCKPRSGHPPRATWPNINLGNRKLSAAQGKFTQVNHLAIDVE